MAHFCTAVLLTLLLFLSFYGWVAALRVIRSLNSVETNFWFSLNPLPQSGGKLDFFIVYFQPPFTPCPLTSGEIRSLWLFCCCWRLPLLTMTGQGLDLNWGLRTETWKYCIYGSNKTVTWEMQPKIKSISAVKMQKLQKSFLNEKTALNVCLQTGKKCFICIWIHHPHICSYLLWQSNGSIQTEAKLVNCDLRDSDLVKITSL